MSHTMTLKSYIGWQMLFGGDVGMKWVGKEWGEMAGVRFLDSISAIEHIEKLTSLSIKHISTVHVCVCDGHA